MIKSLTLASVVAAAALLSGCAATPMAGALYAKQKTPITVSSNAVATKTGVSEKCTSILGLIATGDCSIENAKKNGGIKHVSTVDFDRTNMLGIINTGTTVVTGN
jgi:hypothetical protein